MSEGVMVLALPRHGCHQLKLLDVTLITEFCWVSGKNWDHMSVGICSNE